MSTKIFNAFKLDMSLAETLAHLQKTQKEFSNSRILKDATRAAQFRKLTRFCGSLLAQEDMSWTLANEGMPVIGELRFNSALSEIMPLRYTNSTGDEWCKHNLNYQAFSKDPLRWIHEVVAKMADENKTAKTILDYDDESAVRIHCVVFPYSPTCTVGIFYGGEMTTAEEHPRMLLSALMETCGFKNFEYWDHTDAPDDMTEEEWDYRKTVWNTVLKSGIPAADGFSYDVILPSYYPSYMAITPLTMQDGEAMFTAEVRDKLVQRYALAHVENVLMQNMSENPQPHEVVEAMQAAKRLMHENAPVYLDEAYAPTNKIIPNTFSGLISAVTEKD